MADTYDLIILGSGPGGRATGLVWWADLPLARRTVARVFE